MHEYREGLVEKMNGIMKRDGDQRGGWGNMNEMHYKHLWCQNETSCY